MKAEVNTLVGTVLITQKLRPPMGERRRAPGDALSGGEQQMPAIGRGLLTSPHG